LTGNLADLDETLHFRLSPLDRASDRRKISGVIRYLEIVQAKVESYKYRSGIHSMKIGDDLDQYVLPLIQKLEYNNPHSHALTEGSNLLRYYAQLPMCRPFADAICQIVLLFEAAARAFVAEEVASPKPPPTKRPRGNKHS
jgi:hypothetical protein